jgi:hypothetical protein
MTALNPACFGINWWWCRRIRGLKRGWRLSPLHRDHWVYLLNWGQWFYPFHRNWRLSLLYRARWLYLLNWRQ